jgi:hypothetical protein
MGYAVGVLKWWESWEVQDGIVLNPDVHWRRDLPPNDDSIEAFIAAAKTQGFVECNDATPEPGYEKIAMYYSPAQRRQFKHAAKILSAHTWDSKMGDLSDFTHPHDGLDDVLLWSDRVYMKRRKQA